MFIISTYEPLNITYLFVLIDGVLRCARISRSFEARIGLYMHVRSLYIDSYDDDDDDNDAVTILKHTIQWTFLQL